jgi:hypothetical protein
LVRKWIEIFKNFLKALIVLTLFIFLFFVNSMVGVQFIKLAKANSLGVFLPNIVINSDGTVTPETEFIEQNESVYTLTGDMSKKYAVVIRCSDIVFDGAGHSIRGAVSEFEYVHGGLSLHDVSNVTVKDVEVTRFVNDVGLRNCSKCVILRVKANNFFVDNFDLDRSNLVRAGIPSLGQNGFNTIAESSIDRLGIQYSDNNLIAKNNITSVLGLTRSNKNTVTENNITSISVIIGNWNRLFENNFSCKNNYFYNEGRANTWDNGSVGNYWSDYLTKYPGAVEIGNTGIGNKPYVIDSNNVDNYPFMAPFEVPQPSQLPKPQPEPKPETESFPTTWVAIVAIGLVVIVAVAGYLYYKRRK